MGVAGALLLLAYERGGYAIPTRSAFAIAASWLILVGVGFGILPRARIPLAAVAVGALFTSFAGLTLASATWAPSAESAFNEFNRVSFYLAVFVLAVIATTRSSVARIADGLMLGITAVGLVALISRLFPKLFSLQGLPTFLPSANNRLSFPIGYWNGVGIFVGLGYPFLLRKCGASGSALVRGLALAALPALTATIYFTSSRGGVATALVGTIAFLLLTGRRWIACASVFVAALASMIVVQAIHSRTALANGPVRSDAAISEGRSAALIIALVCVVAGVLWGWLSTRSIPTPPRRLGQTLAVILGIAVIAGIAAAHPIRRFDDFKRPPSQSSLDSSNFVAAHLLSGNGSGRWQFWAAAVHEFESAPFAGRGAGGYESWWAQHASFTYFLRNAHSLYLETLGDLGIVGFVLLVGAFLTGLVAFAARRRSASDDDRVTTAALAASFIAFLVAAGIDWVWQIPALAVVGTALLGLLVGPATIARCGDPRRAPAPVPSRRRSGRLVAVGGAMVAACILIVAQAIPWLASAEVRASQAAVDRSDGASALRHALSAKSLQPWAASPYLQLALVSEQLGSLGEARRWIANAIDRSPEDWRLWLVAARLDTKAGRVEDARIALRRAVALNPRSPLLEHLRP